MRGWSQSSHGSFILHEGKISFGIRGSPKDIDSFPAETPFLNLPRKKSSPRTYPVWKIKTVPVTEIRGDDIALRSRNGNSFLFSRNFPDPLARQEVSLYLGPEERSRETRGKLKGAHAVKLGKENS